MPARLGKLGKWAKQSNLRLEKPTSGSHWKFFGPDGAMYPVPSHNGLRGEISDFYIKKLCKYFDLDEDLFRAGKDARRPDPMKPLA